MSDEFHTDSAAHRGRVQPDLRALGPWRPGFSDVTTRTSAPGLWSTCRFSSSTPGAGPEVACFCHNPAGGSICEPPEVAKLWAPHLLGGVSGLKGGSGSSVHPQTPAPHRCFRRTQPCAGRGAFKPPRGGHVSAAPRARGEGDLVQQPRERRSTSPLSPVVPCT